MSKEYLVQIVTDDPNDLEAIQKLLKNIDLTINTIETESAVQSDKSFKNSEADLIILGDSLFESIPFESSYLPHQNIPVVLFAKTLDQRSALKAMELDFAAVILKDRSGQASSVIKRELLNCQTLTNKEKRIEAALKKAKIGYWEYDITGNELFWSDQVKAIHEVSNQYKPSVEKAIEFYSESDHRQLISEAVNRAINQHDDYSIEAKIITAKGNERWVRTSGQPILENNRCVLLFGTIQDISIGKKFERQTKKAKQQIEDILAHSTNLHYKHDLDFNLLYLSPQSEDFLGCNPNEEGLVLRDFLTDHPLNEKGLQISIEAMKTGIKPPLFKVQLKRRDGKIIWVQVDEAPHVVDGKVTAIVGAMTDVTELVEISDKQRLLSKVAQETDNIVIITDPDQKIEWANKAFERETGYALEEVKGMNPRFLQGTGTDSKTIKYIKKHLEEQQPVTTEILNYTKSGDPYWVELTIMPMFNESGNIEKFFSIQRNITEAKQFVENLQGEKKRLKIAQKVGRIGDWYFNIKKNEVSWSDTLFSIYGRDPGLGTPSYEETIKYNTEMADEYQVMVQQAIEEGKPFEFDTTILTSGSEKKYIHAEGHPEMDDDGRIVALRGIVQDITKRKKKELETLEKEHQIEHMTSQANIVLLKYRMHYDGRDEIVYASNNIEDMLEVSANKAVESNEVIWKQVHNEDTPIVQQAIEHSADTMSTYTAEYRIKTPSGKEKWIQGRGTPKQISEEIIEWDTVLIDITSLVEQRLLNETLIQEVHHRIKNNLAIITGFLYLQLQELPEKHKDRLTLERAINRIQAIGEVHKLLYDQVDMSHVDVKKYLANLTVQISATMQTDTDVSFNIESEVDKMNVNELVPLGILFTELVTNSMRYAFPETKSGQITIKAKKSGDQYEVLYKDNGIGLNQDLFDTANSSGFKIIKLLLNQLEANYYLINKHGFGIEFTFKEKLAGTQSNIRMNSSKKSQ